MEQTAVEWLVEQIVIRKNGIDNSIPLIEIFKQAKEKENKAKLRNQLFKGKVSEIIGENKTIQLIIECNIELQ